MENSRMTSEWIKRVWADNPMHVSAKSGNLITPPVRIAFVNVLERGKDKDGKEKSYGVVGLFPDLDLVGGKESLRLMYEARMRLVKEKAPAAVNNEALFKKLHNPFKDQGEFVNTKDPNGDLYDGFVVGRIAISANSSKSQPMAVDLQGTPITEKRDIYSGCWAILALSPQWFDVGTNKGPTFYLQSVMVVAHDNNLSGAGAANPSADFAAVRVDASVNPAAAFDGPAAGGETAGAGIDLFA